MMKLFERRDRHQRQRGEFREECRPSLSGFSKIRFGGRITTFVTEGSGKTFELSPSFPDLSAITPVARVGSLPFARLVADSLEGHGLLSPSGRFLFHYVVGIEVLE
jgi:hypothetical protein